MNNDYRIQIGITIRRIFIRANVIMLCHVMIIIYYLY
jgi:hypothetical protein